MVCLVVLLLMVLKMYLFLPGGRQSQPRPFCLLVALAIAFAAAGVDEKEEEQEHAVEVVSTSAQYGSKMNHSYLNQVPENSCRNSNTFALSTQGLHSPYQDQKESA